MQSVLVSLAVHSRSDSYYALAPVGLPEGPEFRIHGTTLKTGTLQLAANPFAIFFVDQSQKPVVTPFEGSGGRPKSMCIRSSKQIAPVPRFQSQVPNSAQLNARFSRSNSPLGCDLFTKRKRSVRRRKSLVEGKAYLDCDLPVPDFAFFDVSASFEDLKPSKVPKALRGFGNGVLNGILNANWRRADKLDFLVGVVAHL